MLSTLIIYGAQGARANLNSCLQYMTYGGAFARKEIEPLYLYEMQDSCQLQYCPSY